MAIEEFVGIDVETNGLSPDRDEILEVYARKFDSEGNLGEEFHKFCAPESGFISDKITSINGITMEKVAGCPSYLIGGIQKEVAEFIGRRTVMGHNIRNFDLNFLKIEPVKTEDTLVMCRAKYSKDNALGKACKRVGIKFDSNEAHSAAYDVNRNIELFLRMKGFEKKESQQLSVFADEAEVQSSMQVDSKPQTKVSNEKMLETQTYSFSRINLFLQCPFKWYKRYIENIQEPTQAHLLTGSICHKIAEWSAIWCYKETFASKYSAYLRKTETSPSVELIENAKKKFPGSKEPNVKLAGYFLYENQENIEIYCNKKGIVALIEEMNSKISDEDYEKASMPDLGSFNDLTKKAFNKYNCMDADVMKDVECIMARFYKYNDFSMSFGQVALVEQRLSFKRGWGRSLDWFAPDNFFRGIIDLLEYVGNGTVVITDYKSSRVMKSVEQLKQDMQLKLYALLVWSYLPKNSVDKIIVRINYLRHNRFREYEIFDIEQIASEAKEWIESNVKKIETAIVADDKSSFCARRNEYCSTCFLAEQGRCPLFSKKQINNIDDIETFAVSDIDDCHTAWKRIEANKMENTNLTSKCKVFVKGCTSKIIIDKEASLNFWAKEERSFDSKKALTLFLKKGLKLDNLIYSFNLTRSNFDKILEKNDSVNITDEELDNISKIKIKQEFNACTPQEVENKGYIN